MADDPDPPRKFYSLKPKQFEAVNDRLPPSSGLDSPDSVESNPLARDPGRIDVRDLFKQAAGPGPGSLRPTPPRAAQPTNDVHALLRANAAHADAAGLNALKPQAPRRSRRKRDFWITLFGGYGAIAIALKIAGPNLISIAFAAAGVIILTLSFTWIFWFLMDDY